MIKINIKKTLAGAALLMVDTDGNILLLKRAPESHFAPNQWGFPGGKIEDGETSSEAAIRETQEETKLVAHKLKPLGVFNNAVEAFYSDDFAGNVEIDFEHTEWKWVPPSELEFYDLAPSVLAIFKKAKNSGY